MTAIGDIELVPHEHADRRLTDYTSMDSGVTGAVHRPT